jgi:small subunit ribosomal protein S7
MARRRVAAKRKILPDPRYKSELVTKFINHIMKHGKKSVAEGIVYGALEMVTEKQGGETLDILSEAIENVQPWAEVRARRVGGATYQVPMEVRPSRRITLAIKWIIGASRKRYEKGMTARLAGELLDAIERKGGAVKKRIECDKMAEANKAFAHFRWN